MLLCMAPVVFYFWFISRQYLKVSRDLKRLESVNKSPVYVLFSGRSKKEREREEERKRAKERERKRERKTEKKYREMQQRKRLRGER